MSWSEVKYAVNSTLGTDRFTSLDQVLINSFGGHQMFTENGTFIVPAGITEIYISACAAGGSGANYNGSAGGAGGKAGEFILRERFMVVPGDSVTMTIGDGNTIISVAGHTKTLVANSISGCSPNDVLGYWTGYSGVNGYCWYTPSSGNPYATGQGHFGQPGNGGAFGFGGGGGNYTSSSGTTIVSLGGSHIPLDQQILRNKSPLRNPSLMCGGDAVISTSNNYDGTGGANAGGFGAGGGGNARDSITSALSKGSPGMVFIEWGGLRR